MVTRIPFTELFVISRCENRVNTRNLTVTQETEAWPHREGLGDHMILVKIGFWTAVGGHCPLTETHLSERHLWLELPAIKKVGSRYRTKLKTLVREYLSSINATHEDFIAEKLFEVIDATVSPDLPIRVAICDITLVRARIVPATSESIEGLERLRLNGPQLGETCAICLECYDDQPLVTKLPCSHHFHGDCVLQWLNIHHLCPMCRFALPAQP